MSHPGIVRSDIPNETSFHFQHCRRHPFGEQYLVAFDSEWRRLSRVKRFKHGPSLPQWRLLGDASTAYCDQEEGISVLDPYTINWLHLLARWAHILTGAAWIGTSFYFIFLNNSIRPPDNDQDAGPKVKGVVWMVHGGAFYRTTKYDGAPEKLPTTLHWFKWEAYLTWLSGMAMLALIYWGQARAYMVDPAVADISTTQAVLTGMGSIVGAWLLYDLIIKTLWEHPKIVSVVGISLLTGLAYGLTQLLSARAAYIHVGAIIGTIMAANVLFVIIPNQRVMVNAMLEGKTPDTSKGAWPALCAVSTTTI